MTAIETDELTKRYDDVVAVEDLNLTVERGEVFGFLGPNGAGKSTTIDMLIGFRNPTEGRASVLGHDATSESLDVRSRIGLLPEGLNLYENLSGREHIVTAIQTKGSDDDPDEIIERVGLDPDDARRATGGYSKGMTQRLALGIALVGDPDLLILDEPSSGLDPNGIKRLRTIVEQEVERGATVFFSSHILSQVEQVCDRIGIMHAGRLVTVDDIEGLRDHLGGGVVVEVTLDAVPSEDFIQGIDGVQDVVISDNTVTVTCKEQRTKIEILDRLNETATVLDFDTDETSLESLFEEYTSGQGTDGGTTGGERLEATSRGE